MTSFLSSYVNRVDKKGRVSVPAPYRTVLAGESFQGLVAFRSINFQSIEAFGRDTLDRMNQERLQRRLAQGEFEQTLLGSPVEDPIDTIMGMVRELPFDGEGRILLPQHLAEHAGITDQAVFVGRGNRIEIWSPDRFEAHEADAVVRLRNRLNGGAA